MKHIMHSITFQTQSNMIKNLPKNRFAAIVALFISLFMPTLAKAQEAYAVEDGTTLTFYYDDQRANRTGTVYDIGSTKGNTNITKAVFDSSFKNYLPTSTAFWFQNCSKLAAIKGIENLNTENVTSMRSMFWGCSSLTTLDVTGFNTAKVTNMLGTFYGCSALTSLDVSGFVTDNVTIMDGMFNRCSKLTTIDVSGFNTEKVTDMHNMFLSCSALEWLDLSNFNTEKVTNMNSMFSGCSALTKLDVSNFNTAKVTDMHEMFLNCAALKVIYCIDAWTCDNSTKMFYGCTSLVGAVAYNSSKTNVSMANPYTGYFTATIEFEAYAVEDGTTLTFYNDGKRDTRNGTVYTALAEHQWTGTDITKVVFDATFNYYLPTSTASWFKDCSKLAAIEGLDNLNTSNVTDMKGMFWGCESLISLDLTKFNTEKVTDMSNMFNGCSALTTINCTRAWTCNESTDMFKGCTSLIGAVAYDASKTDVTMANPFTGYFTCDTIDTKAYVVEDGTTLTFYYDKLYGTRTGTVYGIDQKREDDNYHPAWAGDGFSEYNDRITKVVFDASFKDYRPSTTKFWFYRCKSLETIEGIENLNTENVTDMSWMFYECRSLTSLDVSNFNTANVTNMNRMFYDCSALTTIDVSGFNTENVTDMSWMFYNCKALTSLDLSNFNTENVTDMSFMFYNCKALTSLDLSNFNTENVTDMSWMFSNCNLTSLDLSNFNTEKVTKMGLMFSYCSALEWLDLSNFNTKNVTTMNSMFADCSALTKLDLSNFNTENVTNMKEMFYKCSALTTIDVSGFNTENVTDMSYMFYQCNALTSLDVSNFNTENVTNMSYMFYNCNALTTIYCNYTWTCGMSTDMFLGCTSPLIGAVVYDANRTDVTMANPDTGYFTGYKAYAKKK